MRGDRPKIMGRMNLGTWVPDLEKIVEQISPAFSEPKQTRKEPPKWPTTPE